MSSISPSSSTPAYSGYNDPNTVTSYSNNIDSEFDTNLEMNSVKEYAQTSSECEQETEQNDREAYPVVDSDY